VGPEGRPVSSDHQFGHARQDLGEGEGRVPTLVAAAETSMARLS
jgi:hypothetical protein